MQNNNFRGFSNNNRYNNFSGNSGGFQSTFNNQFNYPRNQNQTNLLFSNSNNNIFSFSNSQQNNNNFPIRLNPLSSQVNNSSLPRANSQKKRLYVKLTQEEKGYFSNLFQLVDNQNMGKLNAKDAANFMKKSGLTKDVLKSIYLIASQSSKQFLERDEFYVALRLIALAQNNMPYNAQAIILNKPIPPLPNFNLKKDFLADNDSLFELRDDEKVKYKRVFDINKDGNNDNISARKAIQMWISMGANDNTIKKIADILRPNETKGFLNLREFQVAIHLINLSDKHEIPTQLPNNLRKYLGRPEIGNSNNNNNINIMNLNLNVNNTNNNIKGNNDMMGSYKNIINFDFGNNNNNNMNNCQQVAISSPNIFSNNNNQMNNNNKNELQKTMREIEDLNNKNELLNNQINIARNKLNDIIREIDYLQNEQQNIRNQINLMKQKCSNLMSNMDNNNINNINLNNNNNTINNTINNNFNSNINNNIGSKNIDININTNINSNNNSNSANKNYNISLNQSGIGPNRSILGFNLPQNQKEKDNQKEEYEKLAKQRQNLMDLMNKMNFGKLIINNNNDNNDNNININNNINNDINKNEEIKNNNNKDMIDMPSEKDINSKTISPITQPDINKNQNIRSNSNKFDDRLLESQAFDPEKLEKLAMEEIPNPGIDFNFGDEVVNPYEDENENKKKKDDFNFGLSSPIGDNQFNFDRQSNVSLGSEIKKIDEVNAFPKNDKLENNDSNVFNFQNSEDKRPERKESKESFNFNTMDNQKEKDEWDF